jgi:hypothetical protein
MRIIVNINVVILTPLALALGEQSADTAVQQFRGVE